MRLSFDDTDVQLVNGDRVSINGSIDFDSGDRILLVGDNASGKTTVLLTLHSLFAEPLDDGTERCFGHIEAINRAATNCNTKSRQSSAFVFQEPRQNFICKASSDEIILPLLDEQLNEQETVERLRDLVDAVDVYNKLIWRRRIDNLSSGEQQRIAIAAALVGSPDILLWDEALARVDDKSAEALADLLSRSFSDGVLIAATHRPSRYRRLFKQAKVSLVHVSRSGNSIELRQVVTSGDLPETDTETEVNFANRPLWQKYIAHVDPTVRLFNNGVRLFGASSHELCSIVDLEFMARHSHDPIASLAKGCVFRGLNFAVGKNGSGKTLLLKFLAGQLPNNPFLTFLWPVRASANIAGLPPNSFSALRRYGRSAFLPAEPMRWLTEETVQEELELFCAGNQLQRRLAYAAKLGLLPTTNIDHTSYGQRKVLSLLSLPQRLELVCIDEPFSDLGLEYIDIVEAFVDEQVRLEEWRTVILSSSSDVDLNTSGGSV